MVRRISWPSQYAYLLHMEILSPYCHIQKSQEAPPGNSIISLKGWNINFTTEDNHQGWQSANSIAVENYGYELPAHRRLIPPEEERRISQL